MNAYEYRSSFTDVLRGLGLSMWFDVVVVFGLIHLIFLSLSLGFFVAHVCYTLFGQLTCDDHGRRSHQSAFVGGREW